MSVAAAAPAVAAAGEAASVLLSSPSAGGPDGGPGLQVGGHDVQGEEERGQRRARGQRFV